MADPVNLTPPAISGNTTTGEVLSCSSGTWDQVVTETYQWKRETGGGTGVYADVPGATSHLYPLTNADVGRRIECAVTATGMPTPPPDTGSKVTVTLNPTGHSTAVYLDYGSDPANLSGTVGPVDAGSGSGVVSVDVNLPSFSANSYNFFRARAVNSSGESVSVISRVFTPPAVPHTIHVPADYATLQLAVNACVSGDTIDIGVTTQGTVNLNRNMSGIVRITGTGIIQRLNVTGKNWSVEAGITVDGHGLGGNDRLVELQSPAQNNHFACNIIYPATAVGQLGMIWGGNSTQDNYFYKMLVQGGGLSKGYSGSPGNPSIWPLRYRFVGCEFKAATWDLFHCDGMKSWAFIEGWHHNPTDGVTSEHHDSLQITYGDDLLWQRMRSSWSAGHSGGNNNGIIFSGDPSGCTNAHVQSSYIEHWHGVGVQFVPGTGWIRNLTIYDSGLTGGDSEDFVFGGATADVVNVSVVRGFANSGAGGITGSHNHFKISQGNLSSLSATTTGDPKYTDAANGDYRPIPSSPLAGSGISDSHTLKWGYDGRGWGATPPRGAFAPNNVTSPLVISAVLS